MHFNATLKSSRSTDIDYQYYLILAILSYFSTPVLLTHLSFSGLQH